MSRRKVEPVKHTCPDIDRIIASITNIVNQMKNCDDKDSADDLLENISSWAGDLESIGVGKWCELESLRNSNAALRDWGNEMYNDAETLETERDDFESKYEDAKDKISELENKVAELESRVKELEAVATQHTTEKYC